MDISVIIAAAGSGNRMGIAQNKVLLPLCGKPVLSWSLELFSGSAAVKEIIIAARAADLAEINRIAAAYPKVRKIIDGGETRSASVARALAWVNPACSHIAVHDAARPLLTKSDWQALILSAEQSPGGAILVCPVTDSVRLHDDRYLTGALDRRDLLLAQTPQLFFAETLRKAYALDESIVARATDEAALVLDLGAQVAFIPAQGANFKLTVADDLPLAEAVLRGREKMAEGVSDDPAIQAILPQELPAFTGLNASFGPTNYSGAEVRVTPTQILRYGIGWDIHRLEPGRPLILGGVEIPHSLGLAGHSDADVLLHAVIDALLGAATLGDIGRHFPDNAPAYKNISSLVLLERTHALLREKGWQILHIDTDIIAEKPRLAPYINDIRSQIARTLSLNIEAVSVKAKTAEGLGDIGQEAAIAALALTTIRG